MGKRGRGYHIKDNRNTKTSTRYQHGITSEDMDDEIDAFHKQRDIVPLDINGVVGESDEDNEHPVFDVEGTDEDEDEDDDDDEDDEDVNDDVAKMIRQKRYLKSKYGGVEDEMNDDEEDEEDYKGLWNEKKPQNYGADNRDFELQSSDDEALKIEDDLVKEMMRKKAESLTWEDYGIADTSKNESGGELTLKEIAVKGKGTTEYPGRNVTMEENNAAKDLNDWSKEEEMDVSNSSAPELVGLLSDLNEALEQLESKINPLLSKAKNGEIVIEGGMHYFEVKRLLLLSYCQAISFYLLLKSEGQPVRDHPVIARLVEIKSLLDQMKQLDENLPYQLEDILGRNHGLGTVMKLGDENATSARDSSSRDQGDPLTLCESGEAAVPHDEVEMAKVESLKDNEKAGKNKHQTNKLDVQSREMLKARAALEEKLKQKGLFSSIAPKPDKAQKYLRPVNGQLETHDDFDDEAVDVERASKLGNGLKVSQFLSGFQHRPKVVSGDDDLPKRDDVGERRRKLELRVLAGAGIQSEDDVGDDNANLVSDEVADMEEDGETGDSEDDLYKQVKQKRAAKLAAKAEASSRTFALPSLPETVAGKRQISYQMEKNRGLTRARKKLIKNPRKKYKLKHQKAVKNRKGQVRDIRKPSGPYGGETTGINAAISRSVRFKN
ncbi:Something about silencing protein 10 [Quillaja saponaria]|uniref:Something about silencing protein 10 n=1 Tax=Quillaja saponaria TaxID=32244 RepID=A0AAD7VLW8_QUISA|nr:Something about silencing protein 10 [Quillaja saponaria]KAJ7980648.1 Something about silencing protein 10 [Quillaja saponaria]